MPFGSWVMTVATLSRTSCAATSVFFSRMNVTQHLRHAFARDRLELVDPADRVHRLFELLADLGLDLLRRGAGHTRDDRDGRKVDLRETIDAELGVAGDADDA